MIGVILAAGDGKRLKNSSKEYCCKPLIKVNEKSLIEYSLDNFVELKINEVYIVIGKEGLLIKNALGDEYRKLKLHYVYQPERKGLINAFIRAMEVIDSEEVVVLQLADEIFINFKPEVIKKVVDMGAFDFYCGVTYEEDPQKIKSNFSVEIDKDFALINCTEKPTDIKNNIKGTGFCIFGKSALDVLQKTYDESTNTPNDLCDYMNILIAKGQKGSVLFVADKEFNINTLFDLEEINSFCNL